MKGSCCVARGCRCSGPKKWLASGVQLHIRHDQFTTPVLYIFDPRLPMSTGKVGHHYVSIQLPSVNRVQCNPFPSLVDRLSHRSLRIQAIWATVFADP